MRISHHEDSEKLARPAEITLAGYEMLRLQPRNRRRLIDHVVASAFRLHGMRNASTRVWQEAIGELDCPDHGSQVRGCHE